jgi:hypothetical protein
LFFIGLRFPDVFQIPPHRQAVPLAANSTSKPDEVEKRSAIKFSHIKTYTCHSLLITFYAGADQVFEKIFTSLITTCRKIKKKEQ